MSYADKVFKAMCRDIIDNGTDTKGEKVRPIWTDTGEYAYTVKKFGVVNRYDLRKEFPALTLRKTAIRSAFDELLWIWQKQSNNVNDLNSHIWDEWADETGSIGKAYGYQIGKKYLHHKIYNPDIMQIIEDLSDNGYKFEICSGHDDKGDFAAVYMSQIDAVIYDLRNTPYSRRIITNIYNLQDLNEMNLYPCAYSMTFNVTKDKDYDKLVLNGILNQRSQDTLAANNWNVVQYSLLLMMVAQVCDMIPGELVHMIADAHIYDRHIPLVEELISREEHDAPKVWLDSDVKNFYDFTVNNLHVDGYVTGPQIKNIPIAV